MTLFIRPYQTAAGEALELEQHEGQRSVRLLLCGEDEERLRVQLNARYGERLRRMRRERKAGAKSAGR